MANVMIVISHLEFRLKAFRQKIGMDRELQREVESLASELRKGKKLRNKSREQKETK